MPAGELTLGDPALHLWMVPLHVAYALAEGCGPEYWQFSWETSCLLSFCELAWRRYAIVALPGWQELMEFFVDMTACRLVWSAVQSSC
jgi:hypothetical protein